MGLKLMFWLGSKLQQVLVQRGFFYGETKVAIGALRVKNSYCLFSLTNEPIRGIVRQFTRQEQFCIYNMAAPREMMVGVPQLFQLLASTDDKKGVLQDIKTTLMSSLMPESSVINATIFETLFGCLNTSDGWVD